MSMVLRMEKEHLEAVAELERLCFSEPWSAKALELFIGNAAVGFVCLDGERLVSYGGMLLAPDEGQITNIAVHPAARRQGYGNAVLQALLSEAARRGLMQIALEVRESNAAAIAMYERAGFLIAGRRKRFYRNPPEDGLVMLKHLNP